MKQKHIPKGQTQPKKVPAKKPGRNSFEKIEAGFEKHYKNIFYGLLLSSILVSTLLFDTKISLGGDDAAYIERGWLFLHQGIFPYFQGPGYPVFLSLFLYLFGMSVIKLKVLSLLCYNGFLIFTYSAFRKCVPYLVLFALLAFIAFNNYLQFYSSQTYTESFFLFLQAICILFTFKIIEAGKRDLSFTEHIKNNYSRWIGIGILFTLLSITKSIAFVCIAAVALYFIFEKRYKEAALTIIFFILARVIYLICVSSIFGPEDYGQLELMLRKNPYQPELGHEGLPGMFDRFYINFNGFISVHLYRILNLRKSNSFDASPVLSVISWVIFILFTVFSYRKNMYIFYSAIYFLVLTGGIFFGVAASNMQDRLIIIVMPLIFIVLFYNAYLLAAKNSFTRTLFLLFVSFMLLVTVAKTTSRMLDNIVILKRNLSGDRYFGYTPDLENYARISEWCADSLPDNTVILCRKPEMSFVFAKGKKKFEGIYGASTTDPDSVLLEWKSKKITHVLLASLRQNPDKNDDHIINPAQLMLIPLGRRYPGKVVSVKSVGNSEPAELFEIKY